MIDIYDSEALVKIYRLLKKKCDAIDKFIENHALYFGPYSSDYGSLDVYNNIIELMTRKNQLINLKIILDKAIQTLNDKDKKILLIKINYNLQINEICGILELKERTACFPFFCAVSLPCAPRGARAFPRARPLRPPQRRDRAPRRRSRPRRCGGVRNSTPLRWVRGRAGRCPSDRRPSS